MRVVVAVILLLGGAVPVSASAAPATVPAGPLLAVTLVTGDRVLVRPEGVAAIRPAKGREGVQFIRRQEDGDTYVVPVDAATLVAAGTVDRRLFNVTKLVEHGYDDRSHVRTARTGVVGRRSDLAAGVGARLRPVPHGHRAPPEGRRFRVAAGVRARQPWQRRGADDHPGVRPQGLIGVPFTR